MLNEKNKPRPFYSYLTYLWTWYTDILCWFFVGVVLYALWGTKRHWTAGCLCLEFKEGSWPTRSWYRRWAGTTLGHTILYNVGRSGKPGIVDTPVERHELIHVHQYQVMQLLGMIVTAVNVLSGFDFRTEWHALLLLPSAAALAYLVSMLQALIRGESPYRDNIMEESAYAQDND
jgi:cbb3-type cytochrome oxidase subunit 3